MNDWQEFYALGESGSYRDAWQASRETRRLCLLHEDLTGAALARWGMKQWAIRYARSRYGIVFHIPGGDTDTTVAHKEKKNGNKRRRKEPIDNLVTFAWQAEVKRIRDARKQNGG